MTREEAMQRLKYDREMCYFDPSTGEAGQPYSEDCKEMAEALDIAIEAIKALEKQIPKKLISQNTMWGICPSCDRAVEIHQFRQPQHCEYCGQALDWGEDDA